MRTPPPAYGIQICLWAFGLMPAQARLVTHPAAVVNPAVPAGQAWIGSSALTVPGRHLFRIRPRCS